jgi:hypothetical protein
LKVDYLEVTGSHERGTFRSDVFRGPRLYEAETQLIEYAPFDGQRPSDKTYRSTSRSRDDCSAASANTMSAITLIVARRFKNR